jgi:dipeptidyl aminopeptidase/acylaminoacyl peptidase
MKTKTLKHLASYCLFFIIATQSYFAQNAATPPNGLIMEGIPNISEKLIQDFSNVTDRTLAGLVNWKKDGSLIGYTEYYSPFFLSADGKRKDFQVYPPSPLNLALQSDLEQSLLFTKDKNGNESAQLYKFDIASENIVLITDSPEIQHVTSYLWSKDGNEIYFINGSKERNEAEIYVQNLQTNEKKVLTKLKVYTHYLLDTDGENLLFYRYISNTQTTLHLLNLKSSEVSQISNGDAFFRGAKFSNALKGVWWLSDLNSDLNNLYFYDLQGKSIKRVNNSEMNITSFSISPDEKKLALRINNNGADELRIFETSGTKLGKELEKPEIPVGLIEKIAWRNNDEIGFSFESVKDAAQVRVYNVLSKTQQILIRGEGKKQLIESLDEIRQIKWKSFDGREITGFMLEPKLKTPNVKMPVLIDIHGGPANQYQPNYNAFKTYPAGNVPIVTIFPNIRGSSGFGKEFQNLDNLEKREDAIKDVQTLLDWIEKQPQLDSNRVIVKGVSYGSFISLALGVKEQKRVKAIIAESPIISIKNYLNYSPKSVQLLQILEYGTLTDENLMAQLEKLSALNSDNLRNWTLPLFLSIGENDVRVPVQDALNLKEQLKAKGIPVWFIKAPKEGHFWGNYDNKIFLNVAEIVFIQKFME